MTPPAPEGSGSANPFGYVDHRPFAAFGGRLVYGQRPDGALVHISVVPSGLPCDCVCPACGATLVAHKGRIKIEHFRHYETTSGCGNNAETNAHSWAKEVLDRERRILLPAVWATIGTETLQTHAERTLQFADAALEKVLGDIVPDVILTTKDGQQLLVEVKVTHPCGLEKIQKLRERGLATLEVDLGAWHKSTNRAQIEAALLAGAPRVWLYNKKLDEAEALLRQRIAERAAQAAQEQRAAQERAAAAQRARDARLQRERAVKVARIVRTVAAARRSGSDAGQAEHKAVLARGDAELLWRDQATMGFVVENARWQAALVDRMLAVPIDADFYLPDFDVESALRAIDDCVQQDMLPDLPPDVRADLPEALRHREMPRQAVRSFLDHLCHLGELQAPDGERYELEEDRAAGLEKAHAAWAQRERRRRFVDRALDTILEAIPVEEHGIFAPDLWRVRRIQDFDLTLETLLGCETPAWDQFKAALVAIEQMVAGGDVVSLTLGLPLYGEILRANRRLLQRQEQAAADREARLTALAEAGLGAAASVWLDTALAGGTTPRALARPSADGYARAAAALDAHCRTRAIAAAAERLAADCRARLQAEAEKDLDATSARAFLKNYDAILRASPWDFCTDAATLRDARRELAKWIERHRKTRGRRS